MAEFQRDIVVSFILPSEIYIQYTSEILQVFLYFKERYQVLNLLVIYKLFNVPVDLNLSFFLRRHHLRWRNANSRPFLDTYDFWAGSNYLPLEKGGPFIWTNLNPLYPRMLCAKFGWNWPSGSGEEDENVKSLQMDRQTGRCRQQVIRKAHLSFQLRWAKNGNLSI